MKNYSGMTLDHLCDIAERTYRRGKKLSVDLAAELSARGVDVGEYDV